MWESVNKAYPETTLSRAFLSMSAGTSTQTDSSKFEVKHQKSQAHVQSK
jgi:hypothetical protein